MFNVASRRSGAQRAANAIAQSVRNIAASNDQDLEAIARRRLATGSDITPFDADDSRSGWSGSGTYSDEVVAILREATRGPGVTLLHGPMGVGKSYVLGKFVEQLHAEHEPFALLDAQEFAASANTQFVAAAGEAMSRVYGGDPRVVAAAVEAGRLIVVIDGIEEVREPARLAGLIGHAAALPGRGARILVSIRSSSTELVEALGPVDATVRLRRLTPDLIRPALDAVEGAARFSPLLDLHEELRTPLVLALCLLTANDQRTIAESSSPSEVVDELWHRYISQQLSSVNEPRRLAANLEWFAYVCSRERRPVIREERAVPEWLPDRSDQRSARRQLWKAGRSTAAIAFIAGAIWQGITVKYLVAYVCVIVVPLCTYLIWPFGPVENRSLPDVYERRELKLRLISRRRLLRRIRKDLAEAIPVGIIVIGVIALLVNRYVSQDWLRILILAATAGGGAMMIVQVGKQLGPTVGSLLFAAALGLGPPPDETFARAVLQGLAIGLTAGLASGLVFGVFDLGDRRVYPETGDERPIKLLRRSWWVSTRYETHRWICFGVTFSLVAVLLRPMTGIHRGWLWWGLAGGVAGAAFFGLFGGSFPIWNYKNTSRALAKNTFHGRDLHTVLEELAQSALIVRTRREHAYRMYHVSMESAAATATQDTST